MRTARWSLGYGGATLAGLGCAIFHLPFGVAMVAWGILAGPATPVRIGSRPPLDGFRLFAASFAMGVVLACFFALPVGDHSTGTITLTDAQVLFRPWDDPREILRSDARVRRAGQETFLLDRALSFAWVVSSDPDEANFVRVSGRNVYWGPAGLVSGDFVALRLAQWCGAGRDAGP